MVVATDRTPVVTTTPIEGTKTFRLACDSCDWMETAGSKSVATRKKNTHIAEHRAATHGAPGVPTIMDAIEGDVEMPKGAFRESVPVVESRLCEETNENGVRCRLLAGHMTLKGHRFPEPVKDEGGGLVPVGEVERLQELRREAATHVTLEAEHTHPDCPALYFTDHPERCRCAILHQLDEGEDPIEVGGEEICPWCDGTHPGGPENCNDIGQLDDPDRTKDLEGEPVGWSEDRSQPVGEHPIGWSSPKSAEERERRLEMFPPHTRTMTDAGPDFCKECSDAIQDWVEWPCPAVADKMPDVVEPDGPGELAYALTRSRLEAQRGPSDADKDSPDSAWHAARANSVSATLAAKLGSAHDVDYLIAREVRERLNAQRFWGNAYTRWGREREPHIEAAAYTRHGIEPESCLFFGRQNPRHTASPDGIAIHPTNGQVRLGEYKTSGKELTWAKVVSNGYYDQVQWQLYVLEADHAYLMWEWRHGEKAQYETYSAEPGGEYLIMRDEERIAELIRRANLFLDALDSARAETVTSEPVDPELLHLVTEHLEAKAAAKRAEEDLREFCEANGVKSVEIDGVAKVSYSYGSPRSTFDRERFEVEHPGLYETYLKTGAAPERPTLRVTPKGDDEG